VARTPWSDRGRGQCVTEFSGDTFREFVAGERIYHQGKMRAVLLDRPDGNDNRSRPVIEGCLDLRPRPLGYSNDVCEDVASYGSEPRRLALFVPFESVRRYPGVAVCERVEPTSDRANRFVRSGAGRPSSLCGIGLDESLCPVEVLADRSPVRRA